MPRLSQMRRFTSPFHLHKAPPSNKCSLLWLANWPSALCIVHCALRKCNAPYIIVSFSFRVLSVQARKENRVVTLWWCSYVFAVHKPRLRRFLMGCTLCCDVTLFLSHTTRYAQNAAFDQSKANTWTNNKAYLQSLIQKHQIVIAKSDFTHFSFFFLEIGFVHSQPCALLGSENCCS